MREDWGIQSVCVRTARRKYERGLGHSECVCVNSEEEI